MTLKNSYKKSEFPGKPDFKMSDISHAARAVQAALLDVSLSAHELLSRAEKLLKTIVILALDYHWGEFVSELALDFAIDMKNSGRSFYQDLIHAASLGSDSMWEGSPAEKAAVAAHKDSPMTDFEKPEAGNRFRVVEVMDGARKHIFATENTVWPAIQFFHFGGHRHAAEPRYYCINWLNQEAETIRENFMLQMLKENEIHEKLLELKLAVPEFDKSSSNIVRQFHQLNQALPLRDQFQLVPQSHFVDAVKYWSYLQWKEFLVHYKDSLADETTHRVLNVVLHGIVEQPGHSDAIEYFERVMCDLGGEKHAGTHRKLLDGTYTHHGFQTDGVRLLAQYFDMNRKKPTEYEIKHHTATALHEITGCEFEDDPSASEASMDFVGIDLGNRYIFGACAVLAGGTKRNVTASKNCVYQNTTRKAQRFINRRKMDDTDVFRKERALRGRRVSDLAPWLLHVKNWTNEEKDLLDFYNQMSLREFRSLSFRLRKRYYDLMYTALLDMVNMKPHQKVSDLSGRRVIFAFGMGKFKSTHGLPSLHSSFAAYIIKKVFSMRESVVDTS